MFVIFSGGEGDRKLLLNDYSLLKVMKKFQN